MEFFDSLLGRKPKEAPATFGPPSPPPSLAPSLDLASGQGSIRAPNPLMSVSTAPSQTIEEQISSKFMKDSPQPKYPGGTLRAPPTALKTLQTGTPINPSPGARLTGPIITKEELDDPMMLEATTQFMKDQQKKTKVLDFFNVGSGIKEKKKAGMKAEDLLATDFEGMSMDDLRIVAGTKQKTTALQKGAEAFGESFEYTIKRPIQGILSGALGAGAMGAEFVSMLGVESSGVVADKMEEWSKTVRPENPGIADEIASAAGSSLSFFIPGLGVAKGASILSRVSPKMALWFGAGASAFLEASVEGGGVHREAKALGFTDEQATAAAWRTFAINAVLVGATNKLGLFGSQKTMARRILSTMSTEGLQESLQEITSNTQLGRPWSENALKSGAIGALIGVGMGGASKEPTGQIIRPRQKEPTRSLQQASSNVGQMMRDQMITMNREGFISSADMERAGFDESSIGKENRLAGLKAGEGSPGGKNVPDGTPVPSAKEAIAKGMTEDEFVKGQGTPVFRANETTFDPKKVTSEGVFVSPSENIAGFFGEGGKRPVESLYLSPTAKTLEWKDLPEKFKNFDGNDIEKVQTEGAKWAKEKGYDVILNEPNVDYPKGFEWQVINPNALKTTSQLRAEYQAAKGTPVNGMPGGQKAPDDAMPIKDQIKDKTKKIEELEYGLSQLESIKGGITESASGMRSLDMQAWRYKDGELPELGGPNTSGKFGTGPDKRNQLQKSGDDLASENDANMDYEELRARQPAIMENNAKIREMKREIANAKIELLDLEDQEAAQPKEKALPKRGFLETVQKSTATSQEMKGKVSSADPQTYTPESNKEALDYVDGLMKADGVQALERMLSPSVKPDQFKAAAGQRLAKHYEDLANNASNEDDKNSYLDKSMEIIQSIDPEARSLGRYIQMLSQWDKHSPAWVTRKVERSVEAEAARLENPKKVQKRSDRIQGKVDDVTVPDGEIKKVVERVTKDVIAEQELRGDDAEARGQKLAQSVERASKPVPKKEVDILLRELQKKVKQDIIGVEKKEQPKAVDILREIFSKSPESKDAFLQAQDILKERYADQPFVLAGIEEFLATEYKTPVSQGTLSSATKEIMETQGSSISKIIKKNLKKQFLDVKSVIDDLKKLGMKGSEAEYIAEKVSSDLNERIKEAKIKELQRMASTEKRVHVKKTYMEKVEKLSNLGALTKDDYLDLARKELGIASISKDQLRRIHRLVQKYQETQSETDKHAVYQDLLDVIKESVKPTFGDKFNAFRYQNMLSSPQSQQRNALGNLTQIFITRPATLGWQSITDTLMNNMTGRQREVYMKNVPEYYRNVYEALPEAVMAMKESWVNGRVWSVDQNINAPELIKIARQQGVDKRLTIVTRAMEAADKFATALISAGEYSVQLQNGKTQEEARVIAEEVATKYVFRGRPDSGNTDNAYAIRLVDGLTDLVLYGRSHKVVGPIVSALQPFVITPANIVKMSIDLSPIGAIGGSYSNEQIAKATLGSFISALGGLLAMQGLTTGAAPTEKKKKDRFYAQGKKAWSVKIGDAWVPIWYFGPFAFALAIPASINDRVTDKKATSTEKIFAIANDLARFLGSQTSLTGMNNFFSVMSGDIDYKTKGALGFTASQVVPLGGFSRWFNKATDDMYRKQSGFMDPFMNAVPFGSQMLEPHRTKREPINIFLPYDIGIERSSNKSGSSSTSPIRPSRPSRPDRPARPERPLRPERAQRSR